MDLSRSVGRSVLPSGPTMLGRPGGNNNNDPPPPQPSWHSSRDPNGPGASVNSDQQQGGPGAQSQFQQYPGSHNPASFDGYLQQMSSQPDLLASSPAGSGTDLNRLNKKRGRDDHDELDNNQDPSGQFCDLHAFFIHS